MTFKKKKFKWQQFRVLLLLIFSKKSNKCGQLKNPLFIGNKTTNPKTN